nr:hypothetical protein [Abalone asfa-like virus]
MGDKFDLFFLHVILKMILHFLMPAQIYWFVIYLKPDIILKLHDNFMIVDKRLDLEQDKIIKNFAPFYYIISEQKLYILLTPARYHNLFAVYISDQVYDKILSRDITPVKNDFRHHSLPDNLLDFPITLPEQSISDVLKENIDLPPSIRQALLAKYTKSRPIPLVIYPKDYEAQTQENTPFSPLPVLTNG